MHPISPISQARASTAEIKKIIIIIPIINTNHILKNYHFDTFGGTTVSFNYGNPI